MILTATTTLPFAASRAWDVAVIGAGPAGSVAALLCARRRLRTILIEKSVFPRDKVCGCCLNACAVAALQSLRVWDPIAKDALRLHEWHLRGFGEQARLGGLDLGASVSRGALDSALAGAAVESGATFLPHTTARLGPSRPEGPALSLRNPDHAGDIQTRVVIAAGGLGQPCGSPVRVFHNAKIGAAAIAESGPKGFPPGVIHMACSEGGYVGVVRLKNHRLNYAAAIDPAFVRRAGGLGPAARRILDDAGFPSDGCDHLHWRGTSLLTQRPASVASYRTFLIGDAAGYVEPFTGEGIAWAIQAGTAVGEFAARAVDSWTPSMAREWSSRHAALTHWPRARCHVVSQVLRSPTAMRGIIRGIAFAPRAGRWLVNSFGSSGGPFEAAWA